MELSVQAGRIDAPEGADGWLALLQGGAGSPEPEGPGSAGLRQRRLDGIAARLGRPTDPLWGKGPAAAPDRLSCAERLVLHGARLLEADPLFNAGLGSALQADGVARVSAGMMESRRRRLSAVVNVEGLLHPSELAWLLQGERFRVLDGAGASALADRLGVGRQSLVTEARLERWRRQRGTNSSGRSGTIGCVCVCADGALAAVTSTGGVGNETPGRIGDTPTIAGTYCDERTAVSCTGQGEQIVDLGLAHRVAVRVRDGASLEAALRRSLREGPAVGSEMAAVAVSRKPESGGIEWAAGGTAAVFVWARIGSGGLAVSP